MDDSSTDKSINIISEYQDDRIKLIRSNLNQGVATSRNKGIMAAKGQYIAFLDSDDLWEPSKLEKQITLLESGWDLVCSNYSAFNADGKTKLRISPRIITYHDLLRSCFIGNLTGIYCAKKLGKFFQKSTRAEDYLMWLAILKSAQKAYCIQDSLAKYRISNNSLSSNKLKSAVWQWNIYRTELKFNICKSIYYFNHYVYNALHKRT
ncbi:glycosyltransferase family 2 protein [Providencia sp. 21OH12SH02B-Prov]|nr:glycosyltransferase family 2 protein [Providencia sp. 21OH12SH02B-Prov]WBA59058.1 glycosyltransferase family 2 protein [Providencia sp. 21OH12SH02B-Prov]